MSDQLLHEDCLTLPPDGGHLIYAHMHIALCLEGQLNRL